MLNFLNYVKGKKMHGIAFSFRFECNCSENAIKES